MEMLDARNGVVDELFALCSAQLTQLVQLASDIPVVADMLLQAFGIDKIDQFRHVDAEFSSPG